MGRQIELIYEDEEANPSVAVQKADKLFQVNKVDFLTGTVNSGSTLAVGQVAERAGKLIATTVSFADSITGDKCSPNVFRVNASAGQQSTALAAWLSKGKAEGEGLLSRARLLKWAARPSRRSRRAAEKVGATSTRRSLRAARHQGLLAIFRSDPRGQPQVLYTSVAGNDTVRLFTQMQEFGLLKNLTVVGASGTVTSQNIGAIGKAAEGFVTGVGYSAEIDTPENKNIRRRIQGGQQGRSRSLRRRFLRPDLCLQGGRRKGAVDRHRQGPHRLERPELVDAAGREDDPRRRPSGDADDVCGAVTDGKFKIIGQVNGDEAIGPDTCTRF